MYRGESSVRIGRLWLLYLVLAQRSAAGTAASSHCRLINQKHFSEERAGEQDVGNCDTEIVAALRAALAGLLGPERFELWFGPRVRLQLDGDTLHVTAPGGFFLHWLRASFISAIESACQQVLGRALAIEFHADVSSPESQKPCTAQRTPNWATPSPTQQPSLFPMDERPPSGNGASAACELANAVHVPQHAGPANANGARRRFATLSTFVVGESNRLALASIEVVLKDRGRLNPLTIYGPTSVGKTHLLEGMWCAAQKCRAMQPAVYVTAEQFTTQYLAALRGNGMPSFRRKYRGVALLLVDDLQFFIGKRATILELLHTTDWLLRDGRQVVFAADRAPEELAALGPEMVTRLQSGMVCPIEPPEYDTRLGIVAQLAQKMGIGLPPEVQRLVAARMTRHARELSGALCRLHAYSEAHGEPITLPLAEKVLSDMVRTNRLVGLKEVEMAVCQELGLEAQSLQSATKNQQVSHPRMLAMFLARKYTRAALSEIGAYFGRRSHATVVSAQKRVESWLSTGYRLRVAGQVYSVADTLRRIERRLEAG